MTVSVVVPLYNKERYVRRALDSIAVQTFRDFEVIVVDDGSSDGGPEIAASFDDERFRLVRQPNAGPASARNRGLAQARGEFVAFLDADDAWRPRYLEKAVSAFRAPGPVLQAFTASYAEFPDQNLEHVWRRRGLRAGLQHIEESLSPLRFHYMVAFMTPCSTVARTETVRAYGGFQEGFHYGEDAILWLRVLLNDPVWFDMETLVDVDRGGSGLSGNLKGPRPVEPFVSDPQLVLDHCPEKHRELVRRFIALRAAKTAAMYGYWGRTAEARRVYSGHKPWHDRGHWYTWAGYAATTPAAGLAGGALRAIRSLSRRIS
jgi:glycosyltransferase involved in cell wall biosynthesis